MVRSSVLERWANTVPAGFQFVLEAPRKITHERQLRDVGDLMLQLFEVAGVLAEHRGPLLFQLPPAMRKDVRRLRTFLAQLPPEHRAGVEFRHPSWFDDEVLDLLRDHRTAFCVADVEGDLKVPCVATTD